MWQQSTEKSPRGTGTGAIRIAGWRRRRPGHRPTCRRSLGVGWEPLEPRRLLAGDLVFQPPLEMTAADQLVVELINRARANPLAEAERLDLELNSGISDDPISPSSKPPLAPHPSLLDASLLHALDMLENNFFSHQGLDGSTPTSRAEASGYTGPAGENLALRFDGGQSHQEQAELIHEMLFRSPGHRRNMLLERYSEVGVAIAWGRYDFDNAPNHPAVVGTEKLGIRSMQGITGVAFADDVIEDDFYSVGEGWENVRVEATNVDDPEAPIHWTLTGPSGGYRLEVPEGAYLVTVQHPEWEGVVELGVFPVVEDVNLKFDIRIDQLDFPDPPTDPDEPDEPLDETPPQSSLELEGFDLHDPAFVVRWSGTDEPGPHEEPASGIATYDVYVSVDAGDFELWHTASEPGEREFGGRYGSMYEFYVIATDRAGNREPIPAEADISVNIVSPWQNPSDPLDVNGDGRVNPFDALKVVSWLSSSESTSSPLELDYEPGQELEPPFLDVNGDGIVTPFDVLLIVSALAS